LAGRTVFETYYTEFIYTIKKTVAGKAGVTLATMKAETAAIKAGFVAAYPGNDKP
jgi:hypothetical protein